MSGWILGRADGAAMAITIVYSAPWLGSSGVGPESWRIFLFLLSTSPPLSEACVR